MEKTVYIGCRRTGRGAYTTAHGEVVERSGTGNHWTEKVVLSPGGKVPVTDISNTGKHRCYMLSIDESGEEIRDHNREIECTICEE